MTGISVDLSLKGIFRRISIMLVYLVNAEVALINTALGEIKKAFPDTDPVIISLVSTFPFFIMIFMNFFVVPALARRYDKKSLALIAIALYAIGGFGGAFVTGSIYHILAMRSLIGIGAGISAPLCGAIINELYDGMEKTNMLGWANALSSLIGIVLIMLGGFLCAIKWEYTFFAYGFFIIVLLMVAVSVPSMPAPALYKDGGNISVRARLTYTDRQKFKLFFVCLYGLIYVTCVMTLMVKFAIFISDEKIGDPVVIATGMSLLSAGIMTSSAIFGFIYKFFGKTTIMLPPLLVTLGAFILFKATGQYMTYAAAFIVGLAGGLNFPFLQTKALAIGTKDNGTFANSMVLGVVTGGQFLAAFVEKGVGIFIEPTSRNLMGFVVVAFVAISIVSAIYMILDPLKGVNAAPEPASVKG
jgi:MFS family permease